jgi:ribosome biogenesis protein ENP2
MVSFLHFLNGIGAKTLLDMEMVSLRPGQASTKFYTAKPRRPMPKMVSAQANLTNGSQRSTTGGDASASFGQRRHSLPSSKAAQPDDPSGDIIRRGEDGGMVISFVPDPSKAKEEKGARRKEKQKGQPNKKRPGIEYLGAGLEKGVERAEVSEQDKKGRTHRRKGMRSGSKNTFRRL